MLARFVPHGFLGPYSVVSLDFTTGLTEFWNIGSIRIFVQFLTGPDQNGVLLSKNTYIVQTDKWEVGYCHFAVMLGMLCNFCKHLLYSCCIKV